MIPEHLKPPSKRKYDSMIHELSFTYKLSPRVAETLTEQDFYIMIAEENLKAERQEHISKNATPGGTGG